MRFLRLSLVATFILWALASSQAQEEEYSKYLFNIGGGISFPQGDLGKFANDGGNFVVTPRGVKNIRARADWGAIASPTATRFAALALGWRRYRLF